MSITNERAAEVLRMIESDASDDPTALILDDEESAAFEADYTAALQAGAAALTELTRLRAELAELREPVEVLSEEVECELDRLLMYGVDHDGDFDNLRSAILKFANERGGGK